MEIKRKREMKGVRKRENVGGRKGERERKREIKKRGVERGR